MADYYPLLAKALANLPNRSASTARRAIYERARKALIGQLRSIQPPMPEADILGEDAALEFVELVWGDGSKVERKIINLTATTAFGTKSFRIPFDATGKKWVRFAVWDSAGNGAWLQPVAPK